MFTLYRWWANSGKHQKKKNPVSAQTGNHIINMQTLNDLDLVDGPNMIPTQKSNPHISKGIQKLIFSVEIEHKKYISLKIWQLISMNFGRMK